MPTYNGAPFIRETLNSVLSQSFRDYELIIIDDCSTDRTIDLILAFKDSRIRLYQNRVNLGYSRNLTECYKRAKGDIIFLMADDDILGKDALKNTMEWFRFKEVGAVTRPYFWFDKDINTPVRAKRQLNPRMEEIVKITDSMQRVIRVFQTLDQLSGLAMRREYIQADFHPDIFTCHIYPFASVFKNHPVVFLKDYNVAVRIKSSQTRSLSSIYDKSPIQSWVDMFESVFPEPRFDKFRKEMIKNFVAVNYIGLVQIRNYAKFRYTLREIRLLLKYRRKNIAELVFWFFALGVIIIPPFLLRRLVDWYKNKVNARMLKWIKFSI